jgi:hypothetical protein
MLASKRFRAATSGSSSHQKREEAGLIKQEEEEEGENCSRNTTLSHFRWKLVSVSFFSRRSGAFSLFL